MCGVEGRHRRVVGASHGDLEAVDSNRFFVVRHLVVDRDLLGLVFLERLVGRIASVKAPLAIGANCQTVDGCIHQCIALGCSSVHVCGRQLTADRLIFGEFLCCGEGGHRRIVGAGDCDGHVLLHRATFSIAHLNSEDHLDLIVFVHSIEDGVSGYINPFQCATVQCTAAGSRGEIPIKPHHDVINLIFCELNGVATGVFGCDFASIVINKDIEQVKPICIDKFDLAPSQNQTIWFNIYAFCDHAHLVSTGDRWSVVGAGDGEADVLAGAVCRLDHEGLCLTLVGAQVLHTGVGHAVGVAAVGFDDQVTQGALGFCHFRLQARLAHVFIGHSNLAGGHQIAVAQVDVFCH